MGPAFRIVLFESFAFLFIAVVAWIGEGVIEPILFGKNFKHNWADPLIQTCATVIVAVPTLIGSWCLSKRLHYLEGFTRICAWCRRVNINNNWVSIEIFLRNRFRAQTTHGICPMCTLRLRQEGSIRAGKRD
jgi:hypothetical protein